jgi:hypothetical protein
MPKRLWRMLHRTVHFIANTRPSGWKASWYALSAPVE